MITEELRLLLDAKQDGLLTGMPVPLDGKVGDLRTNVFHGGRSYMMMKAGVDQWLFSAPFTRIRSKHTLEDYLLKSGGKMLDNSLLNAYNLTVRNDLKLSNLDVGHIPYVGAAGLIKTDNGQLFWDAGNNRLSIGTVSPQANLDVRKGESWTTGHNDRGNIFLSTDLTEGIGNFGAAIGFSRVGGGAATTKENAAIVAVQTGAANRQMGLAFFTTPSSGDSVVTEAMRINHAGDVGINEPDPDEKLEVNGNTHVTGDSYWTGDGSGVPYGSMYNDNVSTTVTIVNIGVAVRIPSGFTQGQVNLATFGNSREITVTKAGRYKIAWSISFTMAAGANHEIEGRIGIDETPNAQGSAHRFIGTRTDTGNMDGVAILDLAAGAVVSLMMENDTNTEDIVVDHANLTLGMVGGT